MNATKFEEERQAIKAAIVLGIDVESNDEAMADIIPDLTQGQVDWLASWLASENIGRVR